MRRICLSALTLLFFLPAFANGYSLAVRSYVTYSPNEKYLFVMLTPGDRESDEDDDLKRIFPSSGMYLNDVSRTPLWTVDWYANWVIVLSDGVHVIRHSQGAMDTSEEAIAFFANGKMLRSYQISDLIDTTLGSLKSPVDFLWERETRRKLDENNHTLELVAMSDETYTFDYSTGEMLSARRPLRAFFVLVAAASLFFGLKRFRRWRSAAQI